MNLKKTLAAVLSALMPLSSALPAAAAAGKTIAAPAGASVAVAVAPVTGASLGVSPMTGYRFPGLPEAPITEPGMTVPGAQAAALPAAVALPGAAPVGLQAAPAAALPAAKAVSPAAKTPVAAALAETGAALSAPSQPGAAAVAAQSLTLNRLFDLSGRSSFESAEVLGHDALVAAPSLPSSVKASGSSRRASVERASRRAQAQAASGLVTTALLVAGGLFTAAMIFSKDFRGLMGRLWNVLLGALGMGVKKAETPEIIAQRIIDQLNAAKPEWNKRVGEASTLVHQLRTQVKNIDAKVKELDDTATALLSDDNPNNDGLASGMLQSKMTLESQNATNKEQLKLAEAGLESIKAERERFFNDYQSRLAKVQAQLSRAKQAEINSKIADLKGGFELGGLKDNEDKLGQIVDEMEAGAAGKLDSAESNPDAVIQKAKDELAKSGVQAEIERRKAEIAAKKAAAEAAKKSGGSSLSTFALVAMIGAIVANLTNRTTLGFGLFGLAVMAMAPLGALVLPGMLAILLGVRFALVKRSGQTLQLNYKGLRDLSLSYAGGTVAGAVAVAVAGAAVPLWMLFVAPAVALSLFALSHRALKRQQAAQAAEDAKKDGGSGLNSSQVWLGVTLLSDAVVGVYAGLASGFLAGVLGVLSLVPAAVILGFGFAGSIAGKAGASPKATAGVAVLGALAGLVLGVAGGWYLGAVATSIGAAVVLGAAAVVGVLLIKGIGATLKKAAAEMQAKQQADAAKKAEDAKKDGGSSLIATAAIAAGVLFTAAMIFSKDFRGLMGRLWNVLLGALGMGVKKAETPEIIAQRIVDQLNAAKPEWNKRVAEASTLVNGLRTQAKNMDAKIKELDETATALLSDDNPSNDGLATGMLQSKMTLESQNATNKEQLKLAEAGLDSIKAERERFFNDYQSRLAKVQAQLSRAKQAEINSKIADLKGGFELGGLKDNEDKLGQIVDEMEAGAAGKLDSAESNPDAVIQKAKDELAKSGVQAEIERRKAEIAAKKAAAEAAKKQGGSALDPMLGEILGYAGYALAGVMALVAAFKAFVSVPQGNVAVITRFGKFHRVMMPGLNFRVPFLDKVHRLISIQNQAHEMEFQAITKDQANVQFKAMIVFSVLNQDEATIKDVAFKFMNRQAFDTALLRTVEGSVRSYVAGKKQAEILTLRGEIVAHVKDQLDDQLKSWGYHLTDLQINDISFDDAIMKSMAQVVASQNLVAAATNEGEAQRIKLTATATAQGQAIQIEADAERIAAQKRGEGVAAFRAEVAKGMKLSADEMKAAGLDPNIILFTMWTDAMKSVAENGKGNVIFFDGSVEGMQGTLRHLMGLSQVNTAAPAADAAKKAETAKKQGGSGLGSVPGKTIAQMVVMGGVGIAAGLATGVLGGILGAVVLLYPMVYGGLQLGTAVSARFNTSAADRTRDSTIGGLLGLVLAGLGTWYLGAVSGSLLAAVVLGIAGAVTGYVAERAYNAFDALNADMDRLNKDPEQAKKDGGSSLIATAAIAAGALFTAAMIFSKDFRALMGRLWNVLLGALGMGVKKAETPEIIAQRIIDQLNAAKPEWNKRVAEASTLVNGLRTQAKNMDAKIKELDETATALLSDDNPSNDGLATGMLQSKMTLESQNATNKEQLKLAEAGLDSIKAERERFFNDYQSRLAKVQAQLSRAKQAEINSKIADLKGGFELGGLKDNEDKLGQIVDEMEAGAAGKLDSAESNPDAVIQKAKDELAKSGVQAEIERRKAEIAAKKKAAEEAKKSGGSNLLALAAIIGGVIASAKGKRTLGMSLYGFGTTLMLGVFTGIAPLIYAGLDAYRIKQARKAGQSPDLKGLRNGYLGFAGGSAVAAGLVLASLIGAGYIIPLLAYGILSIAPAISLAIAGVFHRLSTKQN